MADNNSSNISNFVNFPEILVKNREYSLTKEKDSFGRCYEEENLLFGEHNSSSLSLNAGYSSIHEDLFKMALDCCLAPCDTSPSSLDIVRIWVSHNCQPLRTVFHYSHNLQLGNKAPPLLLPTAQLQEVAKHYEKFVGYEKPDFSLNPRAQEKVAQKVKSQTEAALNNLQNQPDYLGFLYVKVLEAKSLPAFDNNGFSDPFCKIYVDDDEGTMQKTKIIQKNLDPEWHEEFNFVVSSPSSLIKIVCVDKDTVTKDSHIGDVLIPVMQLEDGLIHDGWFRLDAHPDDKETSILVNHAVKSGEALASSASSSSSSLSSAAGDDHTTGNSNFANLHTSSSIAQLKTAGGSTHSSGNNNNNNNNNNSKIAAFSVIPSNSSETDPLAGANHQSAVVVSAKGSLVGVDSRQKFHYKMGLKGKTSTRGVIHLVLHYVVRRKIAVTNSYALPSRLSMNFKKIDENWHEDRAHVLFAVAFRRLYLDQESTSIPDYDVTKAIRLTKTEKDWLLEELALRLGVVNNIYGPLCCLRSVARLFLNQSLFYKLAEENIDVIDAIGSGEKASFSDYEMYVYKKNRDLLEATLKCHISHYQLAFPLTKSKSGALIATKIQENLPTCQQVYFFMKSNKGMEDRNEFVSCLRDVIGEGVKERYGCQKAGVFANHAVVPGLCAMSLYVRDELDIAPLFQEYFPEDLILINIISYQNYFCLFNDIRQYFQDWSETEDAFQLYAKLKELHKGLNDRQLIPAAIPDHEVLNLRQLFRPSVIAYINNSQTKLNTWVANAIRIDTWKMIAPPNQKHSSSIMDVFTAVDTAMGFFIHSIGSLSDADSVISFGNAIAKVIVSYVSLVKENALFYIQTIIHQELIDGGGVSGSGSANDDNGSNGISNASSGHNISNNNTSSNNNNNNNNNNIGGNHNTRYFLPEKEAAIINRLCIQANSMKWAKDIVDQFFDAIETIETKDEEEKEVIQNEISIIRYEKVFGALDDYVGQLFGLLLERFRPELTRGLAFILDKKLFTEKLNTEKAMHGTIPNKPDLEEVLRTSTVIEILEEHLPIYAATLYEDNLNIFLKKLWQCIINIIESFIANDPHSNENVGNGPVTSIHSSSSSSSISAQHQQQQHQHQHQQDDNGAGMSSNNNNNNNNNILDEQLLSKNRQYQKTAISTPEDAEVMLRSFKILTDYFHAGGEGLDGGYLEKKSTDIREQLQFYSMETNKLIAKAQVLRVGDPNRQRIFQVLRHRAVRDGGAKSFLSQEYGGSKFSEVLDKFKLARTEVIIEEYDASTSSGLSGALYVTIEHICFDTLFFNEGSHKVVIPMVNIKSIKKSKHLGVFDDALKIITQDHLEYLFAGFTPYGRDKCYRHICLQSAKLGNPLDASIIDKSIMKKVMDGQRFKSGLRPFSAVEAVNDDDDEKKKKDGGKGVGDGSGNDGSVSNNSNSKLAMFEDKEHARIYHRKFENVKEDSMWRFRFASDVMHEVERTQVIPSPNNGTGVSLYSEPPDLLEIKRRFKIAVDEPLTHWSTYAEGRFYMFSTLMCIDMYVHRLLITEVSHIVIPYSNIISVQAASGLVAKLAPGSITITYANASDKRKIVTLKTVNDWEITLGELELAWHMAGTEANTRMNVHDEKLAESVMKRFHFPQLEKVLSQYSVKNEKGVPGFLIVTGSKLLFDAGDSLGFNGSMLNTNAISVSDLQMANHNNDNDNPVKNLRDGENPKLIIPITEVIEARPMRSLLFDTSAEVECTEGIIYRFTNFVSTGARDRFITTIERIIALRTRF